MATNTVAADMAVTIHYTLTDTEGKVLDSSLGRAPMAYLHGHGELVPGLERALEGKPAGEHVHAELPAADAYGERTGPGPQRVPRKEFPRDADLYEGLAFGAQGSDGKQITLWVTKVKGGWVWVESNHPLSGQSLTFDVEILDVRPATSEELAHGHVHGLHGHHH